MADLLSFERGASGGFVRSDSLESLWVEAEALGKVGVDSRLVGGYRATVSFHTASGSHVFAHGTGARPHEALGAAIIEARSLGAGRQSR